MPAARAASSRELPSSTRASASMRRAAFAPRHRFASRRSSAAPGSFRVIATVMAPPPIGYTADQRPRAAHGAVALTVRCRGRWYNSIEPLLPLAPADQHLVGGGLEGEAEAEQALEGGGGVAPAVE